MADYLPRFKPGTAVTFTASADVIGGRAAEVTGDRTAAHADAASTKYIGIFGHSAKAGQKVTVHLPGQVQHAVASGAIAAGVAVQTAANGLIAAGSTAKIGLSISAAADGGDVQYID